jgi:hypothetical protein
MRMSGVRPFFVTWLMSMRDRRHSFTMRLDPATAARCSADSPVVGSRTVPSPRSKNSTILL